MRDPAILRRWYQALMNAGQFRLAREILAEAEALEPEPQRVAA